MTEVHVIEDGSRMPLRDMTAVELSFVADAYKKTAKDSLLREAFLRALAKKVGIYQVGNVLSEEQVAKLWNSISGT